jgi:glycosyltransferase involved in cell wall biosynthesis
MMSREHVRVLYYTDPTAFQIFGGAEIQMMKTKHHLQKTSRDVSVKLFDIFEDKLDDYDILHVFHMRSECLSICKLAKNKGLKIVLSSIYWPETEAPLSLIAILGRIRNLYYNIHEYNYLTFSALYPNKDFLDLADVIVPTSKLEASLLSKFFRIDSAKFFPVPVGAEKVFSNANADLFVKKYGVKDFILFVGRIEQTKNVLTLLKASREINIPLVLIGHYNQWQREYFLECKKMIDENPSIHYLGFMPPDSEELISAYAAAKVFVLPSWHEVTSLTALEAGLAGCNLVITKNSYSVEYLQDFASYVNPASVADIKSKIKISYEKPRANELKERILNNYTWENTAKGTMEAYNKALNSS